jgi:hypothetical protein
MGRRLSVLVSVGVMLAGLAFVTALLVVYWDRGKRPVPETTAVAIGWSLLIAAGVFAAFLAAMLAKRWAFDAHLEGLDEGGIRWRRRGRAGYEPFPQLADVRLDAALGGAILVLTRQDGARLDLRTQDVAVLGRILPRLLRP